MALVDTEKMGVVGQGFSQLPVLRQLGLFIGLAASIAVGVTAVMWAWTPDYRTLYSNLTEKDVGMVADALAKSGVEYKMGGNGSTVLVPAGEVHNARLKLAAMGLPKGSGTGFEILEEDSSFGTSQFLENARYQHALEGELSRTISAMINVQSARVHIAVPKQSSFVREPKKTSASVLVNLYPGRELDDGQVGSIVHLVAASVPNLEAGGVTVVDQSGRLLNSSETSNDVRITANQFTYQKSLESYYNKRIESILAPIVGTGGVKAQVVADIDFTVTEQTQESFNPETPSVRSEQVIEETARGGQGAGGVPGALSNQPPEAGTAAPGAAAPGAAASLTTPPAGTRRSTRNFELDKTISHTRRQSGKVQRLSIAVVVDDQQAVDEGGEVTRTPHAPEEIERMTNLVKEAVGFSEARGDTINVINKSFAVPPPAEPLPDVPFLEQAWVPSAIKVGLAGVLIMAVMFGILKPILTELAAKGVQFKNLAQQSGAMALAGGEARAAIAPPATPQQNNLTTAKTMATQEPARVAQVVKNWVENDAG